jgi:hypothetical protein
MKRRAVPLVMFRLGHSPQSLLVRADKVIT